MHVFSDHRQVAPWRLAGSLTCSDLCFQPLCRALPDRNAGTALQYERIDPASKFYSALECAPSDYIHRVRIGAATVMLSAENKSILGICHQVGYMSLSSFNRQFRKLTGESPARNAQPQRKSRHPPSGVSWYKSCAQAIHAKAKHLSPALLPIGKCVSRLGNALIFSKPQSACKQHRPLSRATVYPCRKPARSSSKRYRAL